MALSLFWSWLFSSWQATTMPLGRWVIRTAESVVLTDCPPVLGGVGLVHPDEVAGEQVRLLAALGAPYLEDDVLVVVRVLRHEQHLEAALEVGHRRLLLGHLLPGQLPHLGVALGAEHLLRL